MKRLFNTINILTNKRHSLLSSTYASLDMACKISFYEKKNLTENCLTLNKIKQLCFKSGQTCFYIYREGIHFHETVLVISINCLYLIIKVLYIDKESLTSTTILQTKVIQRRKDGFSLCSLEGNTKTICSKQRRYELIYSNVYFIAKSFKNY